MFRSSTGTFDRLLEKSTSRLLLEPDWPAILELCDLIRGKEVTPAYAVPAIKKKFYDENPHVQLYALQVMESCVKNCGALVHEEIATKKFMEDLRELVKSTQDDNVKRKILEMIQNWGMAFRNSQRFRIVTDTLNLMKAEGWEFPPVREAEAMFEADVAPTWAEGEVCHRCRTAFTTFTRQHHCRACGQVFCGKCSAKACVLPKFGIEKEVRVCDSCFEEFGPKEPSSSHSSPAKTASSRTPKSQRNMESDLPAEYLASPLSQQAQTPQKPASGKSEAEIKEEEELQLALALSQSEAEEQEKAKQRSTRKISSGSSSSGGGKSKSSQKQQQQQPAAKEEEEIAPELMRYLNRDFWEQKEREKSEQNAAPAQQQQQQQQHVQDPASSSAAAAASAQMPMAMHQAQQYAAGAPVAAAAVQGGAPTMVGGVLTKTDGELDEFVTTLKTQVEIFVNRMKSNSSRGRSIANDSSVQTLFMNTMAMHSQLLKNIQEQEDKRVHFEGLQDKLTQMRDARAALDALREEEVERKRQEAEEAERLRQIQMQEKLEVMRKKKNEYLQYQRQLALQRMQEQEREMLMRQEQMKQQAYMMGQPQMPPQQQMYAPGYGMMQQQPQAGQYPGMAPPQGYALPAGSAPPPDPNMLAQQQQQPAYQPMAPGQQQQPPMAGMPPQTQAEGAAAPPPPATTAAAPMPAYDMQAMASALPPQPGMAPQAYPGQQQPMMAQPHQMQQQMIPGAPGMVHAPPPHPGVPAPQQSDAAELISFD